MYEPIAASAFDVVELEHEVLLLLKEVGDGRLRRELRIQTFGSGFGPIQLDKLIRAKHFVVDNAHQVGLGEGGKVCQVFARDG
jgi:hypothetical protein